MAIVFCHSSQCCKAEQVRILVAPVNIATNQASFTIYPNISEFIANDIINELNRNIRLNVIDINSTENLLTSQGLYKNYIDFLKDYKDKKIIDYKFCGLLSQKLGIDKILMVSSNFSLQNMVLKRPLLYKLGFTEVEPIQSFYRLNTEVVMIDTQICLINFEKDYDKNIRTKNFEVPTNSLNDNIVSTEKIQDFSKEVCRDVSSNVNVATYDSGVSRVRSNIVSTSNLKKETRDGLTTRDGHSYSTNNKFLRNKRIESFKNWIKQRVDL